ncbi:hypothetical protein HYV81_01365 [Candidatus Woesearchaeota archaeon]|nr:hypothetical protein [Candidatus Woesearchaeota archaeon]
MSFLDVAGQYIAGVWNRRVLGIDPNEPVFFNTFETKKACTSFPEVHWQVVLYSNALSAQGFKPPHEKRSGFSGIVQIISRDGQVVLKPSPVGFIDTEIPEIAEMLAQDARIELMPGGSWYSIQGYLTKSGNGYSGIPLFAKIQIYKAAPDPGTAFDALRTRFGFVREPTIDVTLLVETDIYARVSLARFNGAVNGLKQELGQNNGTKTT